MDTVPVQVPDRNISTVRASRQHVVSLTRIIQEFERLRAQMCLMLTTRRRSDGNFGEFALQVQDVINKLRETGFEVILLSKIYDPVSLHSYSYYCRCDCVNRFISRSADFCVVSQFR